MNDFSAVSQQLIFQHTVLKIYLSNYVKTYVCDILLSFLERNCPGFTTELT